MTLPRRAFLAGSLAGLAAVPFIPGCPTDPAAGDDDDSTTTGSADEWASGGTAAMTDKGSYPDPFTAAIPTCLAVAPTTEGPCTTAVQDVREDVSEGYSGLPVRLLMKVVDTNCDPIDGATVRIWHTDRYGVYSGATPNPGMCSNNDAEAIAANWFRGAQVTDADGVVGFDTCFPGWYSGRAVHIHFEVIDGGQTWEVSQLFFPEEVTEEIFDTHPEYVEFGQPDTVFSNDNIVSGIGMANMDRQLFEVERMSDGAMLASAVVALG